MGLSVRPARPDDKDASGLLYLSAAPYYDAFAGSERRARRVLGGVFRRRGHSASFEHCHVAEIDGEVVGVLVAFPAAAGERLARRFLGLAVPRLPAYRWPMVLRHLQASSKLTPEPPGDTVYVDALAVREDARRRGVAAALLEHAERLAEAAGASGLSLDAGIENERAQALYARAGFRPTGTREAVDGRLARAVGGRGFVSYVKPVG